PLPAASAAAGVALGLRPRRVPQGACGHRRCPARGAGMSAPRLQTRAVRAGIDRDAAFGAVTPPLVLSSNFSFDGLGGKRRSDYTRRRKPTRALFDGAPAGLAGGAGGLR